jgi:hypothetical protein
VKQEAGQGTPLDPRLDLWSHSPSGFEWNYPGSGPAQTALAILADATRDDRLAVLLHQDFKREFVARFDHEGFELDSKAVEEWVAEHRQGLDLSAWEDSPGPDSDETQAREHER